MQIVVVAVAAAGLVPTGAAATSRVVSTAVVGTIWRVKIDRESSGRKSWHFGQGGGIRPS